MNEHNPAAGASGDGTPRGGEGERPVEFPYQPPGSGARPAELPDVRPSELPDVRPAERPTETPEQPDERPDEEPTETPEKSPEEVPGEQPAEVPDEQPGELPDEGPAEVPVKSPAEIPGGQPAEIPDERPDEVPGGPAEPPGALPDEDPEERPSESSPEQFAELPGGQARDLGDLAYANGGPVGGLGDQHGGDPAPARADLVAIGGDLFELTDDADLDAALEALLLVVDTPTEEELLASALDQPRARIVQALDRLATGYTAADRGIDLRQIGGGWRFYTRDRYAPYVEKLLLDGQRAKLTRAALETLAVIAYRQPVTRARVAAVRGVNVDGVIRTLIARGLIEETGTDSDTGGFLYRTTELFLERLGLSSLEDLPPIAPLLPEVDSIDDV